MTLNELYNKSHKIPEHLKHFNKYTYLASLGVVEARYLDINDVLKDGNNPLNSYISSKNAVLLFPNKVGNYITDIYIRGVDTKETPLKLGSKMFPFGINNLSNDFKYGEPIVIVEGVADMGGALILGEKNVIAMQSNAMSDPHVELLATLTNRFIFIGDNDQAGLQGFYSVRKKFTKYKCDVHKVEHFNKIKDLGDVVDLVLDFNKENNPEIKESLRDKITTIKKYYKLKIDLIKR